MGALATFAPWTPEDDLLLKNAVEAGASLESLAKGAVQFSRRFSVREIQDRWYSLLYDPIISAEASACMSNFELSISSHPSKFSKIGQSKEIKLNSVKRKAESVRSSYYAMRKRICNNIITSMDLSFLAPPANSNYLENGAEPLPENCMPEGAPLDNFGFKGSNFDPMHCALPENMMDPSEATNGVTSHAFYTGVEDLIEENFPIDQTNIPKKEPQVIGENESLHVGFEEPGSPEDLAVDCLIGDGNIEKMPLSGFDPINHDPGNLCSEFDGDHCFASRDLQCGTSFNTMQLSPISDIPIWRTDECINESDISCNDLKNSIPCGEAYLAELSKSLLNFTNEEELYLMDVDGKDGLDKSYYDGLSSLLLNSPNDVSPDQIPKIIETETLPASQEYVTDLSVSCHVEADNSKRSCSGIEQVVHKSEASIPSSVSAKDPRYPELINGVICCTLNTEDTEVPSNDDVFLPFNVPPLTVPSPKWNFQADNKPISSFVEDFGYSHRTDERGTILMPAEQKTTGESDVSSHMMGSHALSGTFTGSKLKYEFPNSHSSQTACRSAVVVSGGAGGINSANTSTDSFVHVNPKEEATNIALTKHLSSHLTNSSNEKSAHCSKSFGSHPHATAFGMKQEKDLAMPIQDNQLRHAEVGSSDVVSSGLVADPLTSDQEEQHVESEDDVPYYSDIEAMILDMDLDPDDQDLSCSEEVSKYQHEDTKRAIIRLEQGARSYMQRAIASHGAFAVLYDRHSKHYIKKPEVLLGRATEDVLVDIDLGKGGYTNKISRRQAIIKMDKIGSFYLTNLGKSSIMVNNKEVHPGQSQRLHSSCLVEVKGMPFIFETNQSRVKQYLDSITENNFTL
ncbi:hypothetical protein L6164_024815 [Bauhinia variegata]|uniref:Uncharacterized protein n=1 Tax=Bauhinia variegata TaxID=167791 RepID=A0ACB9M1M9_BAUVA|nr:hypothetical protein L6164_024815 [Bauhinia variegata]